MCRFMHSYEKLYCTVDFLHFLKCNNNSNHLGHLFMLLWLALFSRWYVLLVLLLYFCFVLANK